MIGLTTSYVLFKRTFVTVFSWYVLVYMVCGVTHLFIVQVIVVLPNNRKDRYDAIKKMCCVDNPGECPHSCNHLISCSVPSQCVVSRTLSKKQALMSVVTKICLQINCKLGGELWAVEIPVCLTVYCVYG